MVMVCLPSLTSLLTSSQKSLFGVAVPSKSKFQQPQVPAWSIGRCSAVLSALLPLLEKPLKSGPRLPSGRVTVPPGCRSLASFALMLTSLARSLPASWPLAASGPLAAPPPPPQAVSASAATTAVTPPILVRFFMFSPFYSFWCELMRMSESGGFVDNEHVRVQFAVRIETGELLVCGGRGCGRGGRLCCFQRGLLGQALLLPGRRKGREDRAARGEVAALRRLQRRRQVALQDDSFAGAFQDGVRDRNRGEQRTGIGVARIVEDAVYVADFDDLAQVHHGHPVGDVPHHGQVVGHHQVAEPKFRAER